MMCLIDPQAHSSESDPDKRLYWDCGPKAIEKYLGHHLRHCSHNKFCNSLGLCELQIEGTSDKEDTSKSITRFSPKKSKKKEVASRAPSIEILDSDEEKEKSRKRPLRIGKSLSISSCY